MFNHDFNTILGREPCINKMKNALSEFESNKHDNIHKRGIYIYGNPGSGKTMFVESVLENLGYDVVRYDAGDIRNKNIIENITVHNTSDKNVLSMFYTKAKTKSIAIVMDEIDGMNNGDKGGINALIKLIRPKKTKKQKTEDTTYSPIICISNNHTDKKIKELMKVCVTIEIKSPTTEEINKLIISNMPGINKKINEKIVPYINGDLRKLNSLVNLYKEDNISFANIIHDSLIPKSCIEDSKQITKRLITTNVTMKEHLHIINETDRTIVGLLWHENIVDWLEKIPKEQAFPFYSKVLDSICYADYIDRVTFQKQIWQFNEMSSLMKTMNTNKEYHNIFKCMPTHNPSEVRFTKVLTKYSTEYNNNVFIQNICQLLCMDKKDMVAFLSEMKNTVPYEEIYSILDRYDISKMDVDRLYRYIDKFMIPL
jgi:hypothetical protein